MRYDFCALAHEVKRSRGVKKKSLGMNSALSAVSFSVRRNEDCSAQMIGAPLYFFCISCKPVGVLAALR